jgi:outer membrane protein assembly factor BamB
MDSKNILVVGLKGTLVAFEKNSGRRLWSTKLKSSVTADFVSVLVDDELAYAHTGGEIFCVDLFSGNGVWSDQLPGMGYGIASLALPGVSTSIPTAAALKAQEAAHHAATAHSS